MPKKAQDKQKKVVKVSPPSKLQEEDEEEKPKGKTVRNTRTQKVSQDLIVPESSSKFEILKRHLYLQKNIEKVSDSPPRFLCKVCTDNQPLKDGQRKPVTGLLTWLKKHLETDTHLGFVSSGDEEQLTEAIKVLTRSAAQISATSLEHAT